MSYVKVMNKREITQFSRANKLTGHITAVGVVLATFRHQHLTKLSRTEAEMTAGNLITLHTLKTLKLVYSVTDDIIVVHAEAEWPSSSVLNLSSKVTYVKVRRQQN
jgi:hypothetical protein